MRRREVYAGSEGGVSGRGRGPSAAMVAALDRLVQLGVVDELRAVGTAGASKRARSAFNEFVCRTGDDWGRMARELFRRWQVPAAVQAEDVLAELLTAAWRVIPHWDPGKRPLADYVCWNAYALARKWINRQRDAYRRDGKSQSRHPIAECNLPSTSRVRDGTDKRRSVIDQEESAWLQEQPTPEERVDGRRAGIVVAARLPPDQAEAFLLLVEEVAAGGVRSPEYRAAQRLSGATRLRNGISSPRRARGFVGRAQRMAVEAAEEIDGAAA